MAADDKMDTGAAPAAAEEAVKKPPTPTLEGTYYVESLGGSGAPIVCAFVPPAALPGTVPVAGSRCPGSPRH